MKICISYPESIRRVSPRGERSEFKTDIEFSNMSDARCFALDFLCELFSIKITEVE